MLGYYSRTRSTDRSGRNFSSSDIKAVWSKGRVVAGYSPDEWRQDACGAWIQFSQYGNANSENGWEVDHINPVSNGGSDLLANLQPLQWQNNRHKSDTVGQWTCAVWAKGGR